MLRREVPSCWKCKSSLRRRSVVSALSNALFGESLPIRDFQKNNRKGIGFSDNVSVARRVQSKLEYWNTFYHKDPHFDILSVDEEHVGSFDYVICCEVLEHIVPPVKNATEGIHSLLKEGGFAIITVPYNSGGKQDGETVEHFPELHDFELKEVSVRHPQRGFQKSQVLFNTTDDGEKQEFTDLAFHGSDGGLNLEMRQFTKNSLKSLLLGSGFSKVEEFGADFSHFGIEFLGEFEGQVDKHPIIAWK